jgi:hypothetical protein
VRLGAITIDVDSLRFYRRIHGLPEGAEIEDDPIYRIALPRFFELLAEVRRPATLFLIGEDAARHREAFRPAMDHRCEIGSHSLSHDYRLSARTRGEIEDELLRAEELLRPIAPAGQIHGFRAPGYNVSPALLEAVAERGYRYDSSLLPSPLYWLLRAGAIGRHAIGGVRSASMIGAPRAFAGPLDPYRTTAGRPWKPNPRGSILEIPIGCEPATRFPLIGTFVSLLPFAALDRMVARAIAKLECFAFEMHGIDLLDAREVGSIALQPDLEVPVAEKMRRFRWLFRRLADAGEIVTLHGMALRIGSMS